MKDVKEKLKEEIGDVLWYCAEICEGLRIHLADLVNEYEDLMINTNLPCGISNIVLCTLAVNNSVNAASVYNHLHAGANLHIAKMGVAFIVKNCEYLLSMFCVMTIDECMEQNIAKLQARYPEGFDAERSNNRPEEK